MSKVTLALKLSLSIDFDKKQILDGQSRLCHKLYNLLVAKSLELRKHYIQTKDQKTALTLYSKRGLRNLVPELKEENPYLKVVHSSPLKNAALRLSEAIQAYQKSKKGERKGPRVGWPKFRSLKNQGWFSLLYDEPKKGFKVEGKQLILSLGMGKEKEERHLTLDLKEAHLLQGKLIRTLEISCEEDRYYAIFTYQKEMPAPKKIGRYIAIDPNHKNLGYGVDDEGNAIEIKAPQWLKGYDLRIDELKQKRDRCQKKSQKRPILDQQKQPTGEDYFVPSKRWRRYEKSLQRALIKRREQTKTFIYTSAHRLFRDYDCVGIGNYTPQGNGITTNMRRAMNNRSLIGRWKKTLEWVACKSGKTFWEYDEKGTTRTCSDCLSVVKEGIAPAVRQWQCECCKSVHIRDENAAINGIGKLLQELPIENKLLVPRLGPVLVKKRWAWTVLPSGVHETLRGLNCEEIHGSRKLKEERDSSESKVDQLETIANYD